MYKINRLPSQQGYSVELRSAASSSEMRGGLPRARRDLVLPDRQVSVVYNVSALELESWQALYDRVAYTGEGIKADLIIDQFNPVTYDSKIVPGSFQINRSNASRAQVSFQLEAQPSSSFTEAGDISLMDLYDVYGEEGLEALNLLAQLVNEDLPN